MILWISSLVAAQDYLSLASVQERLTQEIPNLESCIQNPKSGSILLSFSISDSGRLQLDNSDECFKKLEAVEFPSHPQRINAYQWSLVVQDKKLFPVQLIEEYNKQLLPGIFSLDKEMLMKLLSKDKEEKSGGTEK